MLGSSSIRRAPSNRVTTMTSSSGYGAVPAFMAFSSAPAASISRFIRAAGFRRPVKGAVALDELAGAAAIRRAPFGDRLVEARGRTAAAVAPEHESRDPRLFSQEFDARLDVQGVGLEADGRLVVVGPRV